MIQSEPDLSPPPSTGGTPEAEQRRERTGQLIVIREVTAFDDERPMTARRHGRDLRQALRPRQRIDGAVRARRLVLGKKLHRGGRRSGTMRFEDKDAQRQLYLLVELEHVQHKSCCQQAAKTISRRRTPGPEHIVINQCSPATGATFIARRCLDKATATPLEHRRIFFSTPTSSPPSSALQGQDDANVVAPGVSTKNVRPIIDRVPSRSSMPTLSEPRACSACGPRRTMNRPAPAPADASR